MAGEQFSLCWDNFHKNMSSGMHSLLESEDLVDVTLAVEGRYLKAHKMVLSVCSPYFRELFQMNPCKHPIVFMKDVSYMAMNDLLTFMYQGEVQVNQEQLTTFIKTAEALQIKGLTNDGNNEPTDITDDHVEEVVQTSSKPPPLVPYENDVISKHSSKSKKFTPHQSAKRQRIASPIRDKPSTQTTKTDPDHTNTADQIIQLKMEPYEAESDQAEAYEENPDDTFADDCADETPMDDSEYQTMLKGEGEEPQAGTSGEGMGESQGGCGKSSGAGRLPQSLKLRRNHRIVHNGFFYNISTTRRCSRRYYRCANKRNSGCLATAVLAKNASVDSLTILRPHNHPPDKTMEMKYNFEMELTKAVKNSNASIKNIYGSLAEIHPEAAKMVPYDQNLCNRLKRRRTAPNDMYANDST